MLMNLDEPNAAKVTMRIGKAADQSKAAAAVKDAFKPMTIHGMKAETPVNTALNTPGEGASKV